MNNKIREMIKNIESYNRPIIIGLPDGKDPRVLEAVKELNKYKNVETLIVDQDYIKESKLKDEVFNIFKEIRGSKNTDDQIKTWVNIPNYFVMGLMKLGKVDCVVGGATTPTADLLRPSLQIIGAKTKTITSLFWMTKNNKNYYLGDCAIVPNPDKDQLVDMTKSITNFVKDSFNEKPFTAMLSFSTNGSGGDKIDTVNTVRQASNKLKEEGYNILGETQFDAAFDANTRESKWKIKIKEQPNIYIFPDLNSGNIGYKIMKLTGDYEAFGPIIVGLNQPVNDLSRGCNSQEIVNLSLITMNTFIKEKK